tara:strand:+ start:1948 stop:3096 length:1149 start_codon:yes stop_codon:yes gene_type:complete
MALSTTVSALTRDKFMPILVDNIFNSNVLCHKLLQNAELLDGGAQLVVPIEYGQNHSDNSNWLAINSGAFASTGQTNTPIVQKSTWDWASAYNSIVMSGEEQFVNSGASQVLSVLKARMSNAEKTIKDLFGTALFNAGGISNGITSLNGVGTLGSGDYTNVDNGVGIIEDLASDTSVVHSPGNGDGAVCGHSRLLGGIDTGTIGSPLLTWWNANVGTFELSAGIRAVGSATGACSFAEFTSTTNGVADGVKAMTRMYGACSIDNDQPDLIVTTQTIYDAYESSLQGNKRFEGDSSLGDAGFQSLRFKGASVVVDSHCPAGHMYFLNTNYLDFKVHAKRNFALEDFRPMETKDGIQARIFWMGQLVCTSPRMQGVLCGGPTGY